jgi:RNA-binding protein
MSLSENDTRALRAAAHKLKPIILIGKAGVTEAVLAELNIALDHHELIKIKVPGEDREARRAAIESVTAQSGAQLVQVIGHIAVLYRKAPQETKKPQKTKPTLKARRAEPARKPPMRARPRS